MTIPRHLRDIVVTEYGVADLRGQSDGECVQRLIAIADSRFQDELVRQAKTHGKLDPHYEVPERYRNNLPQALEAMHGLMLLSRTGDLVPWLPWGAPRCMADAYVVRILMPPSSPGPFTGPGPFASPLALLLFRPSSCLPH